MECACTLKNSNNSSKMWSATASWKTKQESCDRPAYMKEKRNIVRGNTKHLFEFFEYLHVPIGCLPHKFRFAVGLYSDNARMTSKRQKKGRVWLMFLPHFDVLCALSEYRPTAKWNLFVSCNNQDEPHVDWAESKTFKKITRLLHTSNCDPLN